MLLWLVMLAPVVIDIKIAHKSLHRARGKKQSENSDG